MLTVLVHLSVFSLWVGKHCHLCLSFCCLRSSRFPEECSGSQMTCFEDCSESCSYLPVENKLSLALSVSFLFHSCFHLAFFNTPNFSSCHLLCCQDQEEMAGQTKETWLMSKYLWVPAKLPLKEKSALGDLGLSQSPKPVPSN